MWHGDRDLFLNKLDELLNTADDSDVGYFIEVDLRCPDKMKEKTKNFPFAPENRLSPKDNNIDCMKKKQPKNYT